MALMKGGILGLIGNKLSYLAQKQSVLAQNVANADTPAYKAKMLKPFDSYMKMEMTGTMEAIKVTDKKHIVPTSLSGVNAKSENMESFETVPTGNSVDLEQQMMEVSKTMIDYQASLAMYQKFSSLFRTAIGK